MGSGLCKGPARLGGRGQHGAIGSADEALDDRARDNAFAFAVWLEDVAQGGESGWEILRDT
jgi:hypothetical protein